MISRIELSKYFLQKLDHEFNIRFSRHARVRHLILFKKLKDEEFETRQMRKLTAIKHYEENCMKSAARLADNETRKNFFQKALRII